MANHFRETTEFEGLGGRALGASHWPGALASYAASEIVDTAELSLERECRSSRERSLDSVSCGPELCTASASCGHFAGLELDADGVPDGLVEQLHGQTHGGLLSAPFQQKACRRQ